MFAPDSPLEGRVRCEPDFLSRVDHAGEVLDVLVQRRRDDSRGALRLMRKPLKDQGFAGGARSRAIRERMSTNVCHETATSAVGTSRSDRD
jgi:hypothetical protein